MESRDTAVSMFGLSQGLSHEKSMPMSARRMCILISLIAAAAVERVILAIACVCQAAPDICAEPGALRPRPDLIATTVVVMHVYCACTLYSTSSQIDG